mmetsp:Transcript_49621/g.87737  ORF Transcript_49621/g.87737 Transcript_49621/m.87737 type:complete len:262 (+) Transcript_49621:28-813(+)
MSYTHSLSHVTMRPLKQCSDYLRNTNCTTLGLLHCIGLFVMVTKAFFGDRIEGSTTMETVAARFPSLVRNAISRSHIACSVSRSTPYESTPRDLAANATALPCAPFKQQGHSAMASIDSIASAKSMNRGESAPQRCIPSAIVIVAPAVSDLNTEGAPSLKMSRCRKLMLGLDLTWERSMFPFASNMTTRPRGRRKDTKVAPNPLPEHTSRTSTPCPPSAITSGFTRLRISSQAAKPSETSLTRERIASRERRPSSSSICCK